MTEPKLQPAYLPIEAARQAGRHDDALRLLLELFRRADGAPREQGLLFMATFQWRLMVEEYAPTRAALRRVLEEQSARLLAGEAVFSAPDDRWPHSRFRVIADLYTTLGDSRAIYELFVQLRAAYPDAAKRDAFLALEAMVEAGDFALAESYLGDPLAGMARLNEYALALPLIPAAGEPPRLAAELSNFAKDVRLLCLVHRGLGRDAQADALRRAALEGIASAELLEWTERELAQPGALFKEVAARQEAQR